MGLFVVIPQDYDQLPEPLRRQTVPICIAAFDRHGQAINPDWFSRGVAPVRRHLVNIARFTLGDPWCVSELTEATVHRLWERYGSALGCFPARRVLKKALSLGTEMNLGDWRRRKYPKMYVALDALDAKIRDHTLADPTRYAELFEQEIMLNAVEDRLEDEGRVEMRLVYQMFRRGYNWPDIAGEVGDAEPERVKRRFYRWMKKTGGE
jgi:hypothetical protein